MRPLMPAITSRLVRRTVILAALSLCAPAGALAGEADTEATEATVETRAVERWSALLEGDLETAYAFTTPGYRAATPYRQYRGTFGGAVRWKNATVKTVSCDGSRCTVDVDVDYEHARLGFESTRRMEERWLLREGEWWYLPS